MRLPDSWTESSVGELGELQLGKMLDRAKNQGQPTRYLRNVNVRWFEFDLSDLNTISASQEEREAYSIHDGDLLICEGGEPGRCAVWDGGQTELVYQKALHRFRTHGAVLPRLLMYRLKLDAATGSLDKAFTGTTIKHLTRESLERYVLPVPPLGEQRRIVDKLDSLLARVDRCRERLDRVPAILKRFRQAVLASATNGQLIGVGIGWRQVSVQDVATSIFDGPFGSSLKSADYSSSGIRVVRLENIAPLAFVGDKKTYVPQSKYEQLRKHTLLADDVLFSSFVDEQVRVCLLPKGLSGRSINKADCFCVRVDRTRCLPMFLAMRLACRSTFESLEESIHGATRPRINLQQLRSIAFALPSLEEQRLIVESAERLLQLADLIDRRTAVVRKSVDTIAQAIIAKAFRGQLVPQDPSDEPASELLARIRREREAVATQTVKKTPAKRRSILP
ncbi:MAG TPA: restriction endonuclease subunit S [Vicinamibacterales bacterium]|nr:restriction endonuclease subunit S [Vicinamibacterales bacterium]